MGCTTTAPDFNTTDPGWKVRTGLAVWRSNRKAQETAGELSIATHPDGRSVVRFTQSSQPIITAQISPGRWWIEFPGDTFLAGHGPPPSRFIWLHLARFIKGGTPPARWIYERRPEGAWRLENRVRGEVLEGSLAGG